MWLENRLPRFYTFCCWLLSQSLLGKQNKQTNKKTRKRVLFIIRFRHTRIISLPCLCVGRCVQSHDAGRNYSVSKPIAGVQNDEISKFMCKHSSEMHYILFLTALPNLTSQSNFMRHETEFTADLFTNFSYCLSRHLRPISLPEFCRLLRMRGDSIANGGTCYCSMAFVIHGHF